MPTNYLKQIKGKLYLIPTFISTEATVTAFSSDFVNIVKAIRYFIVEDERSARQFLRKIDPQFPLSECDFFLFNEHSSIKDAAGWLAEFCGKDIGVLSQAGAPCVADPGAEIVFWAHQKNMDVIPLVGPSSIILALMASGLPGQQFVFHGYLPKDKAQRLQKLKILEQMALRERQTQIFMETPYHNQTLLSEICSACAPDTLLCLAVELTSSNQTIKTLSIRDWRMIDPPIIHKRPALFLLGKK